MIEGAFVQTDENGDPVGIDGIAFGTATLLPSGESGFFEIWVQDFGEPGNTDPKDFVAVSLETPTVSYIHGEFLGGGNVQYQPPDTEEE